MCAAWAPDYPNLATAAYAACPLFHKINLAYPKLQLIHERPYIFLVRDFLAPHECDALVFGGVPI